MGLFNRIPWVDRAEYRRGQQDGMTRAFEQVADVIVRAVGASDLPADSTSRHALLGLARDCKKAAADIGGKVVR